MTNTYINTNDNIPTFSINMLVQQLGNAYGKLLKGNIPIVKMPPAMLWGPPGIGKSQAIRELATELEAQTGRTVHITDVRLLLFNPIDLRGIPTANEDKTLAIWLKPQIFQMNSDPEVINILFLDEISAAPPSVQAAAYQITLDRVIGEHRLPDNCIVIAAGNRVTDRSVAYKMPKALANRMMHFNVEGIFDSWKEWAVHEGIHPKVISFLSFRPGFLMDFDAESDNLAFATPRSWEMVSNILRYVTDDLEEAYPMISAAIGSGMATEFRAYDRYFAMLPELSDIFAGRNPAPPKTPDALYALTSGIVDYARQHQEDLMGIAFAIRYVNRLPADFSVIVLKDFMCFGEDFKRKLALMPEYRTWLSEKGRLLNGIV